ncbi:MAG: four helix bundle protein [Kiritimatiellae bacterium]|jgi:four helix bundle protein|nr:four helix bundle protein [Kiritimatiellia bacterium]
MYKSFTEMPIWQKAHELSINVFQLTVNLPRCEDFGLTSQIRRSANSVSANIAEGFGRRTFKDKINFYIIARGSSFETQNHLIYGTKVGYFNADVTSELNKEYTDLIFEINKLLKTLKSKT